MFLEDVFHVLRQLFPVKVSPFRDDSLFVPALGLKQCELLVTVVDSGDDQLPDLQLHQFNLR